MPHWPPLLSAAYKITHRHPGRNPRVAVLCVMVARKPKSVIRKYVRTEFLMTELG